jgi:hypothetical protein
MKSFPGVNGVIIDRETGKVRAMDTGTGPTELIDLDTTDAKELQEERELQEAASGSHREQPGRASKRRRTQTGSDQNQQLEIKQELLASAKLVYNPSFCDSLIGNGQCDAKRQTAWNSPTCQKHRGSSAARENDRLAQGLVWMLKHGQDVELVFDGKPGGYRSV